MFQYDSKPSEIVIDEATGLVFTANFKPFPRVCIFSPTLEFITCFTHKSLSPPYSLAVLRNNIYVSDGQCGLLFHFSEDSGYCKSASVSCMSSLIPLYDSTCSIAVSEQEEVYACCTWKDQIIVLDGDTLNRIRTITHRLIMRPIQLRLTIDEIYVILLHGIMLVLSHLGDIKYNSDSIRFSDINECLFNSFCINTNNGNIIIFENQSSQIQVFTHQGKLLYSLPTGGSVIRSGPLAITCESRIIAFCSDYETLVFIQ
ncbi:hypothetical protein LOD99_209 [Oopsacas minuta]|uniref:Uncharacterized protein n=1 Tax=Oopsacas minuta TaxID=111878 RepID=A0AAV7K8A8_9METZ|nr:hypothetical protein LOD99_209 [Oopsacas minuta]